MIDRLIPYSAEVYHGLLAYYYQATSPAHLLALPFGFFIVVALSRHSRRGPIISQFVIAAFWVWVGAIFHGQYFVDLNWAAKYFGYAFVLQGLMIAVQTIFVRNLTYQPQALTRVIGCSLVITGMALSPTIAAILETPISHAHLFGMTPLPLIMAMMGVLIVAYERIPLWLLGIPVLWTIWEALTAQTLGLWHDFAISTVAFAAIIGSIAYKRLCRH